MSFATETNIETIKAAATKFPLTHSQWTVNKVHYDEATNSIRARFKNDGVGLIGGVIKPHFAVKNGMEISEILENVTLDRIVFNDGFTQLSQAFNWEIE